MFTRLTKHGFGAVRASTVALALAIAPGVALAGDPPPSVPKSGSIPGKPQPIATVQLKPGEVPEIRFDEPIFEFGRVPCGKDVLHDYWFTNTGNGPLEILLVKPSCGCTTAGAFDRVVQPGRKGRIPIKVATDHASGRIMKTLTVQTNVAPPSDSTILSIRGDVWKAVQASPAALNFGRLNAGEEANQKLVQSSEITTAGGAVVTLGNLRSTNPSFKPELIEVERGAKYTLNVTAVPPFRIGSNFASIEMTTGVADIPLLQVQCSLLVSPELEVTPDKLMIPANGGASIRPVQIRNNGRTLIQLSNAVCSNRDVSVQLREIQPGRAWTILVNIPEGYKRAAPEGDVITIDTDQSERGRIAVPLVENKLYRPPPPESPAVTSDGAKSKSAAKEPSATTKPADGRRSR